MLATLALALLCAAPRCHGARMDLQADSDIWDSDGSSDVPITDVIEDVAVEVREAREGDTGTALADVSRSAGDWFGRRKTSARQGQKTSARHPKQSYKKRKSDKKAARKMKLQGSSQTGPLAQRQQQVPYQTGPMAPKIQQQVPLQTQQQVPWQGGPVAQQMQPQQAPLQAVEQMASGQAQQLSQQRAPLQAAGLMASGNQAPLAQAPGGSGQSGSGAPLQAAGLMASGNQAPLAQAPGGFGQSGSGQFAKGPMDSNKCPKGFEPLKSFKECLAAASSLGLSTNGWEMKSMGKPKGCFDRGNGVYFNKHPVGKGRSGLTPICVRAS